MQKILKKLSRVKVVFRRSRPLTKAVALCAVVCSMAALLALQGAILDSRARTESMLQQAAVLAQENQDLQQRVNELGTVQSTRRIAQEELGLVDPDTVIIVPQQ